MPTASSYTPKGSSVEYNHVPVKTQEVSRGAKYSVRNLWILFIGFVEKFIRTDKFFLFNRDMIKKMEDGKVYADGKLVYSEGKFHNI